MMKTIFSKLIGISLCFALIASAVPAYAGELIEARSETLRHEAFLRGGDAIATALGAPSTEPLLSRDLEEAIPASPQAASPQSGETSKSRLSKVGWGALIAGFVVSGVLIYKYATGAGASIRNCSTCK